MGDAPSRTNQERPVLELIPGCYYWLKKAYEPAEGWVVGRWEHGVFWGANGQEIAPRSISGPIDPPSPTEPGGA